MTDKLNIFNVRPEVHKPDRAVPSVWKKKTGLVVTEDFTIVAPDNKHDSCNIIIENSLLDLQNYFIVSMGLDLEIVRSSDIEAERKDPAKKIIISADSYGRLTKKPAAFTVTVGNGGIDIRGEDPRSALQGGFFVEDEMNLNEGPVIEEGVHKRRDRFSPRLVHTPYNGSSAYCDEFLRAAAHHGFDVIFYIEDSHDADERKRKVARYNDIIQRSRVWGIRPYVYSAFFNRYHPDAPEAKEYYRNVYGKFMLDCPDIEGILFVGESVEFPSKDKRTNGMSWRDPRAATSGLPCPGWFPCNDYPQWVKVVKAAIDEVNPGCDFIFWSYNWAYCEADVRLELIRNLPRDITLMATIDMAQYYNTDGGVPARTDDYTLAFIGPCDYFMSESIESAKLGMTMYSMSNTAGKTWDIAGVPYLPTPQRWNTRWQNMKKVQDEYSLEGLLESHAYGWTPSFISELAKEAFREGGRSFKEHMELVFSRIFGKEQVPDVIAALDICSKAMGHCIPAEDDQYGPSRYGPVYPFIFKKEYYFPHPPAFADGTASIKRDYGKYDDDVLAAGVEEYRVMGEMFAQAAKIMAAVCEKTSEEFPQKKLEAEFIRDLVEYCSHAAMTNSNYRRLVWLKRKYAAEGDSHPEETLNALRAVIEAEKKNVTEALALLEDDMRIVKQMPHVPLGNCISPGIMSTPDNLRYKLKHLQYTLDYEIN